MLRNGRGTALTVSELLKKNQRMGGGEGGGCKITPISCTPPRLGLIAVERQTFSA